MARKIGVVSPELPSNVQALSINAQAAEVYWFLEMESAFAYLFQHSLDEILLDENLCGREDSTAEKYRTLIMQMRPSLLVNKIKIKAHTSGQDLGQGQLFPRLEAMFKHGELISVFQPIVEPSGSGASIYGYECLSRIRYQGTYFTPEYLFNYAQEKLLLCTYDKICLMQALSAAPKHQGLLIFVNIRPQTLIGANFLPWFKELLKKNHHCPEHVVLEITEQHCIISDWELGAQCEALRKAGFLLAIDDFGSGISNLSLLEIIKPDFIKVSGRFIKGSHMDVSKKKIIKNILELAHDFSIKAVVENVEVPEEWQQAAHLGATLAQGYHFYRPLAKSELAALL